MSPSLVAVDHKPWWKGACGEWLVVAQVALMGLVFLGPRTVFNQPVWQFPFPHACLVVGVALMFMGGVLLLAGLVRLGRGLTPLPYPKDGAELIQTGPFALVRHPMYSGGLVLALGWALYIQGWLTLGYVVALFVFLDVKSPNLKVDVVPIEINILPKCTHYNLLTPRNRLTGTKKKWMAVGGTRCRI